MMRAPYRVLVLQTSELSDLLQTLMALKAAKQLYSELHIDLIVREEFVALARTVTWIDEVIAFPASRFVGQESLSELANWLSPLVEEPWQLLLNWSYTDSGSYLSTLIPAHVKMGYSRRKDGSIGCDDGWSCYIQSVVQADIAQSVHMTDIYTTQLLTALQIHVGEPRSVGNVSVTSRDFFVLSEESESQASELLAHSKRWVAIDLSGCEKRPFSATPEQLAVFAKLILKSQPNFRIALIDDGSDPGRESRFLERLIESEASAELANKVVSIAGIPSQERLVSVLSRCHWVVTENSDCAQLASILGVRSLLSVDGHATQIPAFRASGPYGNGHYVLAVERADSEELFEAWVYANSEWSHQRKVPLPLKRSCAYRSRIRSSEDGGGVIYETLEAAPIDLRTWFAFCLGDIARAWFCGWIPEPAKEIQKEHLSPELMRDLRQARESIIVLKQIYDEAIRTADRLADRTSKLKSSRLMSISDREEVQQLGTKLQELDQLVQRLANVHPLFQVFVNMCVVMMHNLAGDKLSELGEEAARCYRQLQEGAQVMSDWIDRCTEISKPEAVENSKRPNLRLILPGDAP